MDITLTKPLPVSIPNAIRQMGYIPISDYKTQHESWVRTLGNSHYPRFHMYVDATPGRTANKIIFKIHLDQKQSTVEGYNLKRHAGEYDTPVVLAEAQRIQRWLAYMMQRR